MLDRPTRATLGRLSREDALFLAVSLEERVLGLLLEGVEPSADDRVRQLLQIRAATRLGTVQPWFAALPVAVDRWIVARGDALPSGGKRLPAILAAVRAPEPVGEPLLALIDLGIELAGRPFAALAATLVVRSTVPMFTELPPSPEALSALPRHELVALGHRWIDRGLAAVVELAGDGPVCEALTTLRREVRTDPYDRSREAPATLRTIAVEARSPAVAALVLDLGIHLGWLSRVWWQTDVAGDLAASTALAGQLSAEIHALVSGGSTAAGDAELLRQDADFWRRTGPAGFAPPPAPAPGR